MAGISTNKVIAAGVLGFVAGILYAPRKGSETQAQLKERFDKMKKEAMDKADKAKQKIKDMKNKEESAMDKAEQKLDKATEDMMP